MDLKEYRNIIGLAELLDQKQREIIVMKRWVDYKRRSKLNDHLLTHLSKKENPVYETHKIQVTGKYPDIIYEFSKPQLEVYSMRLELLKTSMYREFRDLQIQINKNTSENIN